MKYRKPAIATLLALAMVLAATTAWASEKSPERVTSKELRQLITASEYTNRDVYGPQGEEIGEIEELLIDPQSGAVAMIVVEMGGFLDIGDAEYAVPAGVFSTDRKGARLKTNGKGVIENDDLLYEPETFGMYRAEEFEPVFEEYDMEPGLDAVRQARLEHMKKNMDAYGGKETETMKDAAKKLGADVILVEPSRLRNRPVEDEAGGLLGEIVSLLVNPETGMVEAAVLQDTALMDRDHELVVVPFSPMVFDLDDMTVTLMNAKKFMADAHRLSHRFYIDESPYNVNDQFSYYNYTHTGAGLADEDY
jgi:sporulation protein YlmC with PRC-barrel domain